MAAVGRADPKGQKQPVFVGTKVCATCHDGPAMGDQYTKWLHTKHSRTYSSLSTPQARQIALFSGIPMEPQKSAYCLGCHATGADAEDWEKDDTFSVKDGVQCETCHGPGSEYANATTMRDRKAAIRAGLEIPTAEDCMKCHKEKGSHTRVLRRAPVDIEKGWQSIRHALPAQRQLDQFTLPALPAAAATPGKPSPAKFTGSHACGQCHTGPEMGYQFSRWQKSKHAVAYASLGAPAARKIAAEMGVGGDPRTSTACLKCHATAWHEPSAGTTDAYAVHEGVGCEACHGAGSEYSPEAMMKDKAAAAQAGLKKVSAQTCQTCHANAHGKPFDYDEALKEIAHPTKLPPRAETPRYKTPLNLALRPDGRELYVVCESAYSVIVIDTASRQKVAEIPVGGLPQDVTFSPDGARVYVSNRLDDSVSVIDTAARQVVATLPVGAEPHGVLTDRSGKTLYVLNTTSDSISVIDTATLKETKRLEASRGPWSLDRSPDGTQIYVTNSLPRFGKFRTPSQSEVTILDTERAAVEDRVVVPGGNLLQGIAWHPSGKFALFTLNRTKNLVPMTRTLQGWTITNGLGVLWADGRADQLLLDEPGVCFPDPADVAIAGDGRLALITSSSSDLVAVVDVEKLVAMLQAASPKEREDVFPHHLGKATEFVLDKIPTPRSPRGILIARDDRTAYTANALDDSVSVLDIAQRKAVQRIDLGGPQQITKIRFGEQIFNSSRFTFQRQFSCHSCHPDGHIDGLTYDTMPDGIGNGPVDNRTLRGILDTAPFKWEGTNPSLSRQCGARLAVFFTRVQPFSPEELDALDTYICTIPRPPNRYRPVGAKLTETQRRGKTIFERKRTNDGREIPKQNRCVTCHFPPLFSDRDLHDVGTRMWQDEVDKFDTPQLTNIWDSPPYLHNGIAETLEEIWTRFNPEDKHGVTNDMTKDQLNDLIEYLKTL